VDATTDTAYVANACSDNVSVIDGSNDTVTATISVGSCPAGIAVDAATDTAYVTNDCSDNVSVIDGSNDTVTVTVPVGSCPEGVAVDATTDAAYVTNDCSDTVSVIDGSTGKVTATTPVGDCPAGVSVDTATDNVFVADDCSGTVSVLTGLTDTVTGTVLVGSEPEGVAANPSTDRIYVADAGSAIVSVIDGGQSASQVTLSLTGSSVTYGHEQTAVFKARVTPTSPSEPTGSVTITSGTKTLCHLTLSAGSGHCSASAAALGAGTYVVTASYAGNTEFDSSTSSGVTLTVAKATSKASLVLSASKVAFGHEQAEHLSVSVTPEFAGTTPTGTISVRSSGNVVCTMTLSHGRGSCTLSPRELAVGLHDLVAHYAGNGDFGSAASAPETLEISA
jgi:YVTN family beta-propeller protein